MEKTLEEKILNDTIDELQGSCISGEIEWDTCILAMQRFAKEAKKQTVIDCKEELLKHLQNATYRNGYPIKAVPQASILSLDYLMKNKIEA